MEEKSGWSFSRKVLMSSVVAVILATAALVTSMVLLRQEETFHSETLQSRSLLQKKQAGQPFLLPQNKVWMITIGHDYGAHEYLNQKGYLSGFGFDLLRAVCSTAGITCVTVWDTYINVLKSEPGQHTMGGKGLMGSWYDAAAGWYTTIGRTQIYKFSKAYLQPQDSKFWVTTGKKSSYRFSNSQTIGFLDGWASDEKCLARQGPNYTLPAANIRHYVLTEQLVTAMKSGEVAAAFVSNPDIANYDGIIPADNPPIFSCMMDGNAMMMRKDSVFDEPFNTGLNQVMSSGQFDEICQKAAEGLENGGHGHKGDIKCK